MSPSLQNFPPSIIPPNTSFEHLTVDEIDAKIAEHEAVIAEHQAIMAQHYRAIAKFRGCRNRITDVMASRLPVEILQEILLHCSHTDQALSKRSLCESGHYEWLKLAHVCRRWRNLVCSLSRLFSRIYLFSRPSELDILKGFLPLSGQRNLHLLFYPLFRVDECHFEELTQLLFGHMHRVETVKMTPALFYEWQELYRPMANLQSFTLLPSYQMSLAPSRRKGIIPSPFPSSLRRLTLIGHSFRADLMVEALANLPRLEELQLEDPDVRLPPDVSCNVSNAHISSLKFLRLEADISILSFFLQFLNVTATGILCVVISSYDDSGELQDVLQTLERKVFHMHALPHSAKLQGAGSFGEYWQLSLGSKETINAVSATPYGELEDDHSDLLSRLELPRLHVSIMDYGSLSTISVVESISQAFPLSMSHIQRFVVNVVKHIQEYFKQMLNGPHFYTLELVVCHKDAALTTSSLYNWLLDMKGTPTSVLSQLRTLTIHFLWTSNSLWHMQTYFRALHDALRVHQKNGLVLESVNLDFHDAKIDEIVLDAVARLKNVVADVSYTVHDVYVPLR